MGSPYRYTTTYLALELKRSTTCRTRSIEYSHSVPAIPLAWISSCFKHPSCGAPKLNASLCSPAAIENEYLDTSRQRQANPGPSFNQRIIKMCILNKSNIFRPRHETKCPEVSEATESNLLMQAGEFPIGRERNQNPYVGGGGVTVLVEETQWALCHFFWEGFPQYVYPGKNFSIASIARMWYVLW